MQPCEQAQNIASLKENAVEIKNDIHAIKKTIFEGNGKPAIMSQLAVGNARFEEIDKKLDGLDKKFDTLASYGRAVALAVLGFMGVIFWQMVQKHAADTYYNTSDKLTEVSK